MRLLSRKDERGKVGGDAPRPDLPLPKEHLLEVPLRADLLVVQQVVLLLREPGVGERAERLLLARHGRRAVLARRRGRRLLREAVRGRRPRRALGRRGRGRAARAAAPALAGRATRGGRVCGCVREAWRGLGVGEADVRGEQPLVQAFVLVLVVYIDLIRQPSEDVRKFCQRKG